MLQKQMLVKSVETDEAIVGLRADGIIHVFYKSGTVIDLDLQDRVGKILQEIAGGMDRPCIYEAEENVTVTKEARDNAIQLEDVVPQSCSVVYVNNLAYKLVAQFYYKFNKPRKPYKVMTDFGEGIAWLLATQAEIDQAKKNSH